jgi:Mg/Co/Ni transporter MgtE
MPELPSEKVDRIIKKYDAKLSTRIDAIKEANGFITDQEAIDYIAEIDAERKEDESVPVV